MIPKYTSLILSLVMSGLPWKASYWTSQDPQVPGRKACKVLERCTPVWVHTVPPAPCTLSWPFPCWPQWKQQRGRCARVRPEARDGKKRGGGAHGCPKIKTAMEWKRLGAAVIMDALWSSETEHGQHWSLGLSPGLFCLSIDCHSSLLPSLLGDPCLGGCRSLF